MKTIEQLAEEIIEQSVHGASISDIMQLISDFINWIPFEQESIPKDGKEYLTKNDRQGGVLSLISWNKIHNYYQNKGEYVFEQNAGTHWKPVSFL